jgi:hypothetical protein
MSSSEGVSFCGTIRNWKIMKKVKAGEMVILNGVTYVVERARSGRCVGCTAFERITLCNLLPYCGDITDVTEYIIFKKKETISN